MEINYSRNKIQILNLNLQFPSSLITLLKKLVKKVIYFKLICCAKWLNMNHYVSYLLGNFYILLILIKHMNIYLK